MGLSRVKMTNRPSSNKKTMDKRVQFDIGGMHCAACSARIEKVINNLSGITTCSVNLATQKADIRFDPKALGSEEIRAGIEKLGFTAVPVQQHRTTQKQSEQQHLEAIRHRLIPLAILSSSILLISMGPMLGLPFPRILSPDTSPLYHALLQFVLILPVLYLGRNFYLSGIPALVRGLPNMDSLIAIGTGAAVVYSTWNLLEIAFGIDPVAKAHDLYFESAAVLITLISLGKYLEMRSKVRTGDAITALMRLAPAQATVLDSNGGQRQVAVEALCVGDIILLRPGERVPVDGTVVEGNSSVDQSMLTGESLPVVKTKGSLLYSGTLNTTGTLHFSATRVGEKTTLARIIALVEEAQGSKAPIARFADRVSLYFVPVVIAIAVLAGLSWFFLGEAGLSYAVRIFIAVMVIACPCAMGLATPTSIMVGTGRGAQLGILIKTGEILERAQATDCIVFDKTGTLTIGKPEVTDIVSANDWSETRILSLAASLEQASEHPLASAIVHAAKKRKCQQYRIEDFTALPGSGVQARVEFLGEACRIFLGNAAFISGHLEKPLLQDIETRAQELASAGKTVLYLATKGALAGLIAVADPLKTEAQEVIGQLTGQGLRVVMLTGDTPKTAEAVAAAAGIRDVIAGVLPAEKAEKVQELQKNGHTVAMVGDGINDAPALACADVGIAMGSGIDVAMESADIVLMNNHLEGIIHALALSRATMKNIRQNLFWAFAYNVIGIPVAAGVLVIFGGPALNPMLGGAAMAMSSVSVVTNALRLRHFSPKQKGP